MRNVSFAWQQQTRPPAASAPPQHTALHGGGGGAGETHQGPRALFRLGSGKMELDNKAHLLRALQMYEARHQCKANQVYPATIELSSKAKCLQAHFSKVCALVHLLYQGTTESAFENLCVPCDD